MKCIFVFNFIAIKLTEFTESTSSSNTLLVNLDMYRNALRGGEIGVKEMHDARDVQDCHQRLSSAFGLLLIFSNPKPKTDPIP